MSDSSINVPDGYEVHETIEASASIGQYIARHKADDALVRLEMFDFSQTASATTRRHLREYLRTNITFMEELELAGVLRVFDYSDTKTLFWVATQPAEVYKLSKRFDLLASQPLQRRQGLVRQFLATVQAIHGLNVAHRSLSSDAVFLSSDLEVFIGEFGFACYFTDHSTTSTDTTSVTAACYQPPEVRDAKTLACDVRCDVFSCGLLAFEILSATMLPKDEPAGICEVVRARLNEPAVRAIIGVGAAEVILKAVTPLPEERWLNVSDFADALQRSLQDGPAERPAPVDPTATVGITKPVESSATVAIQADAETMRAPSGPAVRPVDAADGVTPLDPKHEIWNNRYEILDKIGEGGQAIVYKAYDHLTNEEIAIKTIWSRHREDRSAINRLKQGAMVARSLTHRHIIKTYSVEQRMDTEGLGKHVFICMELISSQMELRDVIEARQAADQKIRVDEALHIIRQLLDALAYAHEHTIHRDIKPGNIMLVPRDDQTKIDSSDLTKFDIRLIDFGIAKVLSQKHIDVTGKGFRSAHYGAPELADAKTGVDARADIFSVGVILYQMLTKALPHKGSPPANKANKDVPAALAKVIDRAVNADRAKRFKTASELLTEIDKAVSKFNWVRKAARVAAILLVAAGVAGAVKYFLPEPDYGYVQPTIETLEARAPDKEIAALDESSIVKLSDVEDYGSYDELRKNAIEKLRWVEMAGTDRFNRRSFSPWSDQERVWMQIEPAVSKIESIATDRKDYVARKDMPVVTALVGLSPSAERLEEVRSKTSRAETLLKTRPLLHDDLELCADAYDLGAKVYQNIEVLAGGSDRPETAVQINNELKNVEELRSSFLQTHASLDVERLGDSGFDDLRERCLQKANRYCQSFELGGATKYFSLLTQICGTMAAVQDQIDFKRSDMALVSTRLMDLCYEDIEAFENYPAWQQRLQQVHRTKDFLAKYRVFQGLVSSISENAPAEVYDHAGEARRLCELGELDEAAAELAAAAQQHKDFIRQRLEQMNRDCDFLSTCKGVNTDSIADSQRSLSALSDLIDRPDWPQGNFADQYNRCLEAITSTKGTVRQALIGQARQLKQEITQAGRTAQQQDFFWKSERIGKYVAVAAKYRADEVEDSIAKWKHVEDLRRISRIVEQMRSFDSYLAKVLARKLQLDGLAEKIDKDIHFCTQFKGISQQERDQYRSWQSELEQLRSRLTARQAGTYLIDCEDQAYRAEYDDVSSKSAEIHDKLPYHRNRVIQLMDRTRTLQKTAEQVLALRQHWAGVLESLKQLRIKRDFAQTRTYLESVTVQVDEWDAERFSRQMKPKCKLLADGINEQNRAVAALISVILDEKSRLVNAMASFEEAVAETLNDPHVRKLDALAAADRSPALAGFRQLPAQLPANRRKLAQVALRAVDESEGMISESDADFTVDAWLIEFDARSKQLEAGMSQRQAVKDTVGIFQQARQTLAQRPAMEKDYYLALRDHSIGMIDYSDASGQLASVEADEVTAEMCNFLEQLGNDSAPSLQEIKANLTAVAAELSNLKTINIAGLSEIKDFNQRREGLLRQIAAVEQNLSELSAENLERLCKQSVTQTVQEIKGLTTDPGQTQTVSRLSSILWAFLPEHSGWEQWTSFLELYHLGLSGEDVHLTSSASLRPAGKDGGYLSLTQIAADFADTFYISTGDSDNFGWPRYVGHQKDPSVILVFVPATGATGIKPFYMARREISNLQYRRFMEQTGAKSQAKLTGWSYFTDNNGNPLICQAQGQYPPCRITWNGPAGTFLMDDEFKDAPVTWVMCDGARAYAGWLGGQLPTVAQHKHAALAGAGTTYPWGNDLSDAASYAHVRSAAWQSAAREYNAKRDNPVEIAYPPVGAVKDYLRGETLAPTKVAHAADDRYPVWPCFTDSAKPNDWGLYDMLGNVWEWCTDPENDSAPVICGGSCLSPPEYARPDAKHLFKAQACDVGFRVVIPAE